MVRNNAVQIIKTCIWSNPSYFLVVEGPQNTAYQGGFYHGKLVFPVEFPFKPPRYQKIIINVLKSTWIYNFTESVYGTSLFWYVL